MDGDAGVISGHAAHDAAAPDAIKAPVPPVPTSRKSTFDVNLDRIKAGTATPPASVLLAARRKSIELNDYFVGPMDLDRHSKIPHFLRIHGSVTPRMILPLTLVGAWATLITCISEFVRDLGVATILLTVLGFVVGLALSFRSSTAYERYTDGRKAWATLSMQSRNLARYFWVHVTEREGEEGKEDLLGKLTGINLILAFAVALKHKLRFEPFAHYPDLDGLISHLGTFAHEAADPDAKPVKKKTPWKRAGEFLGLTIAASNPRKAVKDATRPVGNLPNEILVHLAAYVEGIMANGTLGSTLVLSQILTSLAALTDVQAQAERVLTTPLPVGYSILISQIVLLYVYLLPFQLYSALGWVTIPGTVAAAYIIMGLAAIGNELENPFGNDVNDLPLDQYCEELRRELDYLTSTEPPKLDAFFWGFKKTRAAATAASAAATVDNEKSTTILTQTHDHSRENKVLWPLSEHGPGMWKTRPTEEIRGALRAKVAVAKPGTSPSEREREHMLRTPVSSASGQSTIAVPSSV